MHPAKLPLLLLIAGLFTSDIFSQSIVKFQAQPIEQLPDSKLDQVFLKYELYALDMASCFERLSLVHTNCTIEMQFGNQHVWNWTLNRNKIYTDDIKSWSMTATGLVENRKPSCHAFLGNGIGTGDTRTALIVDHQFFYGFTTVDGIQWYFEPLYIYNPDADKNILILYRSVDVKQQDVITCAHKDSEKYETDLNNNNSNILQTQRKPNLCVNIKLNIASEYSIYAKYNQNQSFMEAHHTGVMNNVQANYIWEFEKNIVFQINEFWTSTCGSCDPWDYSNPGETLMKSFRDWSNAGGFVDSDFELGQLWTSVVDQIGNGYSNSICSSNKYHMAVDWTSNAELVRTALSHAIGHNLGAGHSGAGYIMAWPLNGSTNAWAPDSKANINAKIASSNCLPNCSGNSPVIEFSADTVGCKTFTVQFSDQSLFNPIKWNWNFPGGYPTTSTVQNPTVTYVSSGVYSVKLTASNLNGIEKLEKINYIHVKQKPVANYHFIQFGETVEFYNKSKDGEDLFWDFGDGTKSNEENPSHQYINDGTYQVKLKVTNTCGSHTLTKSVTIQAPPKAGFTATPLVSCNPSTVTFNNISSNAASFTWIFEGGVPNTSTAMHPTVTYSTPGEYDVTLIASNANGTDSIFLKKYITINSVPFPKFSSMDAGGNKIQFQEFSLNATSSFWLFGDGDSSKLQNPLHQYAQKGIYPVQLTSTNNCGSVSKIDTLYVGLPPKAKLISDTQQICQGGVIQYQEQSKGFVTQRSWIFEGGVPGSSTDISPKVQYPVSGSYTVTLIVSNAFGSDTMILNKYIQIQSLPSAIISFTKKGGNQVHFTSTPSTASQYLWNFGDGTTSTEANPIHIYKKKNVYFITLIISNSCGMDTIEEVLDIFAPPQTIHTEVSNSINTPPTISELSTVIHQENTKLHFHAQYTTMARDIRLDQMFEKYELYTIDMPTVYSHLSSEEQNYSIDLLFGDQHHWIWQLNRNKIYTDNIKSWSMTANGLIENRKPTCLAFLGNGIGNGDTRTALTVDHQFFYGFTTVDGIQWYFEPLYLYNPDADKNILILYRSVDVKQQKIITCGHKETEKYENEIIDKNNEKRSTLRKPFSCLTVKLNIASEYSIYVKYSMNQSLMEAHHTGVMNNVQTNYISEFDKNIVFQINEFWTSTCGGCDPWDYSNPVETLMKSFKNWGNAGGFIDSDFDLGQLWSTNLYLLGDAYLPGICSINKYHMAIDWTSNAELARTALSHGIGHNFGAYHTGIGTGFIMSWPMNGSSNTWAAISKSDINGKLASINCLANCNGTPPEAEFSADTIGCKTYTVQFFDQSLLNPIKWNWSFPGGNPTSSTLQNPTVTYAKNGFYNVKLTASNLYGYETIEKKNYIHVKQKPIADYYFLQSGAIVDFINESKDGEEFLWDFGDGTTSNEENPTHQYINDGTYQIKLKVTNTCASHTLTKSVIIQSAPKAGCIATPLVACNPSTVTFNNISSNAVSFSWIFEGGVPNTSTAMHPTVTYSTPGKYDVTLIASNANGADSIVLKKYITINSVPVPKFSSMDAGGNKVQFQESSLNATSSFWLFGDGDSSKLQNPIHHYIQKGIYPVQLTTTNNCGSASKIDTLYVGLPPKAILISNTQQICQGGVIQYQDQSKGFVTQRSWIFEGGVPGSSTDISPKVQYPVSGSYTVTLIVSNAFGSDTLILNKYIQIQALPSASIGFTKKGGNQVYFTSTPSTASQYLWNFGDGTTSTDANPIHVYKKKNVYFITLIISNSCGMDTIEEVLDIFAPPQTIHTEVPNSINTPPTISELSTVIHQDNTKLHFHAQYTTSARDIRLDQMFEKYELYAIDMPAVYSHLSSGEQNYSIDLLFGDQHHWNWHLNRNKIYTDDIKSWSMTANGLVENRKPSCLAFLGNGIDAGDTRTALTVDHQFFYGFTTVDGIQWYFEPLYLYNPDADKNILILYRSVDVKDQGPIPCGHTEVKKHFQNVQPEKEKPATNMRSGFGCLTTNLNLASDYQIYVKYNQNQSILEAHHTGVMNNVQVNFIGEFNDNIIFSINEFWTSTCAGCDPWDYSGEKLLFSFRDWGNGGGFVDDGYDLGQLWTTHEGGGAKGYGFVSGLCSQNKYHLAVDWPTNAGLIRTALSHSIGHNLGAGHSMIGTIMSPSIDMITNTWNTNSKISINAKLASNNCLLNCENFPLVDFKADTVGCNTFTVKFFDQSSNKPTSWNWSFPGGNPSYSGQQNPIVKYVEAGYYKVILSACNLYGCHTEERQNYIHVKQIPVSLFSLSQNQLNVNFLNTSKYGELFQWDFGDGSTSQEENPSHQYIKNGTYQIKLIVSNTCGSHTLTKSITIQAPPKAGFNATPLVGCSPSTVTFNNLSSNATSFMWIFEGGVPGSSTDISPKVQYPVSGSYAVTLIVSNTFGSDTMILNKYIQIQSLPSASIGFTKKGGNQVYFTSTPSNATQYLWNFGDGTTSTEANPIHIYKKKNVYFITLIISNSCGMDTIEEVLDIFAPPQTIHTENPDAMSIDALQNNFNQTIPNYYTPWFMNAVDAVSVKTESLSSVTTSAKIIPNPSNGLALLMIQGATIGQTLNISITNTLGKRVSILQEIVNIENPEIFLPTELLPPGHYQLIILLENQCITLPFIRM